MKVVLYFFSLLLAGGQAFSQTLCKPDEKIAFSCEIGSKNVSACVTQESKLKYAYGTRDNIEIELYSPLYSSSPCPGGSVSRLRFNNGNYSYIVHDFLCNSSLVEEGPLAGKNDYAGLIVLNKNKVILNEECSGFADGVFGVNSRIFRESVEEEEYDFEILGE